MTAPETSRLLEVSDLTKTYAGRGRDGGTRRALAGVSLTIDAGEILGVVGESGCGKSTLARCITGLVEPSSGSISFRGEPVTGVRSRARREARRHIQMVFQDPYASLNPRKRLGQIVAEPMRSYGVPRATRATRVAELLTQVGLSEADARRYPRSFSGGQRQRVGIARAIALNPGLLIADEPVSALDVSIQAHVLNLLVDLRDQQGLAILLISHDLSVVRHVADRVMVMRRGRVVEAGRTSLVYANPVHPYTRLLLDSSQLGTASLEGDPGREAGGTDGEPGDTDGTADPPFTEVEPGHWALTDPDRLSRPGQ